MQQKAIALAELLLKGNQDAAWELVDKERKSGVESLSIYGILVTNAMRHIGSLWESNKITVADEHLATSTCDFLLARYHWQQTKDLKIDISDKKAMFFCVENEQHYLGLKMSSHLFVEAGWESRFHGPNLPIEYVKKTAEDWKPDAICLSFSILYHAEHLGPYINELEKLPGRPAIIVGGRLLSQYDLTRHGSDKTVFIKNLEEVKNWLDRHPLGVKTSVGY